MHPESPVVDPFRRVAAPVHRGRRTPAPRRTVVVAPLVGPPPVVPVVVVPVLPLPVVPVPAALLPVLARPLVVVPVIPTGIGARNGRGRHGSCGEHAGDGGLRHHLFEVHLRL